MVETMTFRMPAHALSKFVDSMAYNLLIGVLTFLTWFFKDLYIPCILLGLCSFLALATKDGKAFFILALVPICCTSDRIEFAYIPMTVIIPTIGVILTMIIYLFIKRPAFYFNKLCIPWLCLAMVMSISLIYNVFFTSRAEVYTNAFFYVLYFFILIFFSVLVSSITYRGDSLLGVSKAMAVFGLIIAAEVFAFFIRNPDVLGNRGACTLGWANNANVVSMYLIITIPFFGILAYKGYWYYFLLVAVVAFADMTLASRCGYLCLSVAALPLIFLSFRNYKKARPYIYLTLFTALVGFLFTMVLVFPDWFRKIIEAFEDIGFDDNGRDPLYEYGLKQFRINPLLGTSANCLFFLQSSNGNINLLHSTIITYMATSGVLGLLCLAACYIMSYGKLIFVDRDPCRFHIILFLVLVDIIGTVDNGIVDPIFVYIILIVFGTLKKAPDPKELCSVRQSYFNYYRLHN